MANNSVVGIGTGGALLSIPDGTPPDLPGASHMLAVAANSNLCTAFVAGLDAMLAVEGRGSGPLWYQWRWKETAISDATNSTLHLVPVTLSNAGVYDVVVSNQFGRETSRPAEVTVDAMPATKPHLSLQLSEGIVTLLISTAPVSRCRIECLDRVDSGTWRLLGWAISGTPEASFKGRIDSTANARFYRAVQSL